MISNMLENNLKKRTIFLVELLTELKNISIHIEKQCAEIKKNSKEFYRSYIFKNKIQIQDKIDQYKINNENIISLNIEITKKTNLWYEFIKNPDETKKVFLPVRFYFKKVRLGKYIKNANEKISRLAIENRFIKENISEWEHKQSISAELLIKQGKDYLLYTQLIERQETLISDIRYILPSISGICPVELSLDSIGELIERIDKIVAA